MTRKCKVAFAFMLLMSCRKAGMFSDCSDDLIWEGMSPDRKYVLSVVERNCGATTDYSTLVSLRSADQPLSLERQKWVHSLKGRRYVEAQWTGARSVGVRHEPADVFANQKRWKDVDIVYSVVSNPDH